MRADSQDDALKRAIKFLSYCGRSEAEVKAKLYQQRFPPKVVQITLEKLRSLKVLDDEAFARSWASARVEGRGYGPVRVVRELQEKGVAKPLVDQVVKEIFSPEEVRDRAKRLLEKRFRSEDLSDARVLRRAVGFLRRRGYRDSTIAELIGHSLGED